MLGRPNLWRRATRIQPYLVWGVVLPFLVWVGWMAAAYRGLTHADALDWAQAARHLARGDGFVTSAIVPLSLRLAPTLARHPDLFHPPAFAVWEAFWFLVLGARPVVAAFASGAAWLLCLWLAYAVATRLFHREAAFFAAALLVANGAMLVLAVSGLPQLLTGAVLLGLFWLLGGPAVAGSPLSRSAGGLRWPAAAGALAGLAVLSDYNLAWAAVLFPGIYWVRSRELRADQSEDGIAPVPCRGRGSLPVRFLWGLGGSARLRFGVVFAVGLVVVLLPWLVRNARLTGDPLANLGRYDVMQWTHEYPGGSIYRRFPDELPDPWEFALVNARDLVRKEVRGIGALLQATTSMAGVAVLALFLVGCLRPPGGRAGRVQRYFLATFVLSAALLGITSQRFDLLAAFVPGMTVFAAAAAHRLLCGEQQQAHDYGPPWWSRRRVWGLWAAVALAGLPTAVYLAVGRRAQRLVTSANVEYLASKTAKGGAVMTDSPWLVAWYGDRPAVWLAQDRKELAEMERRVGPLPWLYFTRYRVLMAPEDLSGWWVAALASQQGYEEFRVHPSRERNEVLLRRVGATDGPGSVRAAAVRCLALSGGGP